MTKYKRAKLVAHDRQEKFNPAFDTRRSRRYKHKTKPRRKMTIAGYQYAGRGHWEKVQ